MRAAHSDNYLTSFATSPGGCHSSRAGPATPAVGDASRVCVDAPSTRARSSPGNNVERADNTELLDIVHDLRATQDRTLQRIHQLEQRQSQNQVGGEPPLSSAKCDVLKFKLDVLRDAIRFHTQQLNSRRRHEGDTRRPDCDDDDDGVKEAQARIAGLESQHDQLVTLLLQLDAVPTSNV
jgi:hypothetical protein